MNKSIKPVLLFILLCFFLLGVVSAADSDSNQTDTAHTLSPMTEQQDNVQTIRENADNNKILTKDKAETVKTATNKIKTKILVDQVPNVSLGDSVLVLGTLTDKDYNLLTNSKVKLDIDGDVYNTKTDEYGDFYGEYLTTTPGTKILKVSYAGNSKYAASSATKTFKVTGRYDTEITVNDIKEVKVGKNTQISGYLYDDEEIPLQQAKVTLNINGKKVQTRTYNSGYFKYNYKTIKTGTNTVKVTFAGNSIFKPASATKTFKVEKQNTYIKLNNIRVVNVEKDTQISGNLYYGQATPVKQAKVILNINGKKVQTKTYNSGYFKYTYKTTKAGTNTVKISYPGNSTYKASTAAKTFKVEKQNTYITLNSIPATIQGNTVSISGYYRYGDSQPLKQTTLTLNINGQKTYTRTNNNGYYQYNYKTTKTGTNKIKLSYPGNSKFKAASKTGTFNVKSADPQTTYLTLNSIAEAGLGSTVSISGYYTYGQSEPLKQTTLTLTINGQRAYAKTDNNGYYQYNYKTTKLGTNTVTVSYPGNTNFKAASVTKSFQVSRQIELYTYLLRGNYPETSKQVGYGVFQAWYQTADSQYDKGVNVEVYDIRADDMGYPPYYFMTDATFYFVDSAGNVITRQYTDGTGDFMYHPWVNGYTPLKVIVKYRPMTQSEINLWNAGYGYDPVTDSMYPLDYYY